MGKKIAIALVTLVVLGGIGVGAFFIIKNISDENHKKDIEMAADCARTFEVPSWSSYGTSGWAEASESLSKHNSTVSNNRRQKRQECAEKYHVTHQEIIDKIGEENYYPR